jgi:arylsulfatase A-like enzyme
MLRLLWFTVAATVSLIAANAAERTKPNLVLIMADDMGYSDLGCYGSEIRTPHLDALAANGLKFAQFYTYPRCCPTRAALLTGVYPHQAGVGHMVETSGRPLPDHGYPGYKGEISDRVVTIAEVLRDAGYRTGMSGKWHLTPFTPAKKNWPLQRGFEEFYGTIHGAGSFYDPVSLTRGNEPAKPEGENFYYTDAISDHAVGTIRTFTREKKPFFLYVAYTAPHWPMHALPEDIAKYEKTYLGGWDELRATRYRRLIELGLIDPTSALSPRDPTNPAWAKVEHKDWEARRMAVYAAMIDRMDQGIGKIMTQLRASGVDRDTLVLFLSDNGGCAEGSGARAYNPVDYVPRQAPDGRPVVRGNFPENIPGDAATYSTYGRVWANASNTPFRSYKHWVHEGGIATPFIAHWPAGIRQPRVTRYTGHIIDVMATCLDLAAVPYPKSYHGRSIVPVEGRTLRPVFEGRETPVARELYWEHEGNRAVRDGKWKLVANYNKPWELYDMEADRTELHDLAARQPGQVKALSAKFDTWAKRVGVVPWEIYSPIYAVKKGAK